MASRNGQAKLHYPKAVDIENVRGYCNAKCFMCPISTDSVQEPLIMSDSNFQLIVDKLALHKDKIERIQIVGLGEPTLDKTLSSKIKYALNSGMEVGIVTNLGKELSDLDIDDMLLASFIVISIDSIDKDSYERIRVNLDFERTLLNIKKVIARRNNISSNNTRIQIRTIETLYSKNIFDKFCRYWSKYLDFEKGDLILEFPEHNWADAETVIPKSGSCNYIYEHMSISANGEIQMCCIDYNHNFVTDGIGNAFTDDPIKIYNNETFNKFRNLMDKGKINSILPCDKCDVPNKREARNYYNGSEKQR